MLKNFFTVFNIKGYPLFCPIRLRLLHPTTQSLYYAPAVWGKSFYCLRLPVGTVRPARFPSILNLLSFNPYNDVCVSRFIFIVLGAWLGICRRVM